MQIIEIFKKNNKSLLLIGTLSVAFFLILIFSPFVMREVLACNSSVPPHGCNECKGEGWCELCQQCLGPQNAPKTCGAPWCGSPPPQPCGCSAPSAPTITNPGNGTNSLNPDALMVEWTFPGSWGSDSGNQPSCYNYSPNDIFYLYYTRVSGPGNDLGIGASPGVCSGATCYVALPTSARSFMLYNLQGSSTYQILVRASTGNCGSDSNKISISTKPRPRFTFLGVNSPSCNPDNAGFVWSGLSDNELGDLAAFRSAQANNPVFYKTKLDLKTNNISMLEEINIQIAPDPSNATLNRGNLLRAKYQDGNFHVYDSSTGTFIQTTGNQYENDYVILQMGPGKTDFRQVSSPSNTVETDFYVGFKKAYTSGKFKIYLSARFKETSPDVSFYALSDSTVKVQEIAADGVSWNVLKIENGSNQGIWGVDMIPPSGKLTLTINRTIPNIANLSMNVTDSEAYLKRVFNRQYKRYLNISQAATAPWQPYIDIYGKLSNLTNFDLPGVRYWPGPTATATFADRFSELYGGNYDFRVMGEDMACNVGAITTAQNASAAWLRVYGGDIYSKNIIDLSILPLASGTTPSRPNQIQGSFLTSFFGAFGASRDQLEGTFSNQNWSKSSYTDMSVSNSVDYLKNVMIGKGLSGTVFPLGATNLWTSIKTGTDSVIRVGTSLSPINLSINANEICPRTMVVFVSGDLTITPPFTSTYNRACIFVVDRNVTIVDPTRNINNTDMIDAAFVVGGRFNSTQNTAAIGQNYFLTSAQLIINGQVITKEALFSRNLGDALNKLYPAEDYRYDPKYLMLLNELIGSTKKYVFECNAVDAVECITVN